MELSGWGRHRPLAGGSRLQGTLYAAQECLRSAISSIRAHGLRSFLTMFGILWGIVLIVLGLLVGPGGVSLFD